jgi:dipeptidyl aminopeptidase/acylaminoacyl peptidase
MAQRFDANHLALAGEPVPLAEDVGVFWASENGVLVYSKAAGLAPASRQLLWFDRTGKPAGQAGSPSTYLNPRLSPDGHRVAVDVTDSGSRDIFVIDLANGVSAPRTFDPAVDLAPVWSPDGSRIAFASARGDNDVQNKLYQTSASGVGTDELLFAAGADEYAAPMDWSSDGRYILFARFKLSGSASAADLWALPMSGAGEAQGRQAAAINNASPTGRGNQEPLGDKKPIPLLQSPFRKGQAQISPDGRWLAYATNESGSFQIVVQPFPDPPKGKWQVTSKGGVEPRWRRDGRELFYLALDGKLMAVPIKGDSVFESGPAAPLFQTTLTGPGTLSYRYDVTADGQRFLLNVPVTAVTSQTNSAPIPITAVVNWTAALKR